MYESFSMFQFAVDNAASVERSVALLVAELPTHTDWILQYFTETRHSLIAYGFFVEHMRLLETEADLALFRQFLQASEYVPDRWLLKAACDQHCRLRHTFNSSVRFGERKKISVSQPTMLAEQSECNSDCNTGCIQILEMLLDISGAAAAVDDWICMYLYEVPELLNLLLQKKEEKIY
jgi:hypothetical protein